MKTVGVYCIQIALHFTCVFATLLAHAEPICVLDNSERFEKFSDRLSELPALREMILELSQDPLIPKNIQRILNIALIETDTVVKHLTQSLREETNIHEAYGALLVAQRLNYEVASPPNPLNSIYEMFPHSFPSNQEQSPLTLNQKNGQQVNMSSIHSDYIAFVQNRPIEQNINDFITLVHELSHVRFNVFMKKNIETLYKNLPSDMVWKNPNGIIIVNHQLKDFLDERYAHQTEFELLLATVGKYYPHWYSRYDQSLTLKTYKSAIAEAILEIYEISDPKVQALKDFSIFDILRGKPFNRTPK